MVRTTGSGTGGAALHHVPEGKASFPRIRLAQSLGGAALDIREEEDVGTKSKIDSAR
jgi:hypothetical protein